MNIKQQFTEVEFGQQKVKVPKGGYYDRFRMHPDLDEIAQDPAAGNIDFFRHIPKKNCGVTCWSCLGAELLLS